MKKLLTNLCTSILYALSLIFITPVESTAQARFQGQNLNISVTGTSTLHDWDMKSTKGQCDAVITVTNNRVTFSGLTFTMPAESLKSGNGAMDKNTYKALKTDKNPNIIFVLSSVNSITTSGQNSYVFKGAGKLTIAGTTKVTDITATLKYNPADKSFTCVGSKKFKMSEYGVKPPTVMLGTLKTGDDITINYNINLKSL